jgi:cytidylate kinase
MPLIAMTREMGSLGKDVATEIADRLSKQVVHHEFIDGIANKMRLRKSHVIRFLDGKSGILERLTTDKTSLSIYTADETFSMARNNGIGVIRGWGAPHVLRSVPHVISLRVCAPFEVRVKRMMERLGTTDRAFVESEIKLADEAHSAITRRNFNIEWRDPEQYDLSLNTERLTIKECADEVMALLDDPEFQETTASMRTLDDLALAAWVRSALRQHPRTAKMMVSISAADGVVTLEGIEDYDLGADEVAKVISAVPGVRDIVNKLRSAAVPNGVTQRT